MAGKSAKLRVFSVADSIPTGLTMIEAQIWCWAEGYSYTAMAAKKPGSPFAPPRYGSDHPVPDKSAQRESSQPHESRITKERKKEDIIIVVIVVSGKIDEIVKKLRKNESVSFRTTKSEG